METKSNISLLGFRRRMMQAMASKSELPQGYFPCEYIESDGASFIDTGLLGKSGLQVKCKCSFNDIASVHNVFGVLEGTNRLFIQYDNAEGLLYAYGAWNDTNASISANEAYEMDATFNVGSQSFKLDGTELYSGTSSTNISTSLNAYLFALNLSGTPIYQAKMRLYYCKIYDNGTLVRDYIPCVNPEGYYGLYDNVTCEFYGFDKEIITPSYSIYNPFDEWYKTSMNSSLDPSIYDGLYESTDAEDNDLRRVYIKIKGVTEFTCLIWSYGETNYDYVMISQLDKTLDANSYYDDTTTVKAHTRGNRSATINLNSAKVVTYTGIDKGEHTICCMYRKDGSDTEGADKGYLAIKKPTSENGKNVNVVGRGKVILPSGYINAEYIESDGNAWIDSGYIAQSENYRARMTFAITEIIDNRVLFGGGGSTDIISVLANNPLKLYVGNGSIKDISSISITTNTVYSIDCYAKNNTIDVTFNSNQYSGTYSGTINKEYSLALLANNVYGVIGMPVKAKMYMAQIHDNGVFIKFFIPCMKDGVFGLYEMYEKVFYSSEGSSEFSGQLNQ